MVLQSGTWLERLWLIGQSGIFIWLLNLYNMFKKQLKPIRLLMPFWIVTVVIIIHQWKYVTLYYHDYVPRLSMATEIEETVKL